MLTACLNLVQLHDVCDLHDQPKVGCCFFLRLPTFCNKFNKTKKTKKQVRGFAGPFHFWHCMITTLFIWLQSTRSCKNNARVHENKKQVQLDSPTPPTSMLVVFECSERAKKTLVYVCACWRCIRLQHWSRGCGGCSVETVIYAASVIFARPGVKTVFLRECILLFWIWEGVCFLQVRPSIFVKAS